MPVLLTPRMLSHLSHLPLFFNHQSIILGIDEIMLPTTANNQGQLPAPESLKTVGGAFSEAPLPPLTEKSLGLQSTVLQSLSRFLPHPSLPFLTLERSGLVRPQLNIFRVMKFNLLVLLGSFT